MSMISSLIDELNKSADEWNGSNMFELARMCRDAADTIWQLRDDLQRANDAVRDAEHDESRAWDRVRKVEAENAKLRDLMYERAHKRAIQHMTEDELRIVATNVLDENANLRRLMSTMRKTLDSAESDVCSHCDFFGNCADNDWYECEFDKRMRELGIGVSE